MHTLTVLSLIYAAILVVALAASLLLITFHLRRISRALKLIEAELVGVAEATGPLNPGLTAIANEVAASMTNIQRTHSTLAPIAEPLAKIAEKLGLTELA